MQDTQLLPRRFPGVRRQISLFLVTAVCALIGAVLLVAYKQGAFVRHTKIYFFAEDVFGINKGMSVRLFGLPVVGYACEVCYYNYNHNGSNNFAGNWWTFVDVQFGPTLNPAFSGGGPTYGGNIAYGGTFAAGIGVAEGNTGNTTCAGLYCHGDNPEKNLMWEGAAKTPAWTGTVACGACHKADATFRQGNHAVHIDNTGTGPNLRGPGGIAVFSPAGNCSDGTSTGCHTAYGKTPTTAHARGTATVRSDYRFNYPYHLWDLWSRYRGALWKLLRRDRMFVDDTRREARLREYLGWP